jgi:hypothetical protein
MNEAPLNDGYRAPRLAEPAADPSPKRPGNIILALVLIGWLAIVGSVISVLTFIPTLATGLGQAATGTQWATVLGGAFAGLLCLALAALLEMVSEISASSYAAIQELKSVKAK